MRDADNKHSSVSESIFLQSNTNQSPALPPEGQIMERRKWLEKGVRYVCMEWSRLQSSWLNVDLTRVRGHWLHSGKLGGGVSRIDIHLSPQSFPECSSLCSVQAQVLYSLLTGEEVSGWRTFSWQVGNTVETVDGLLSLLHAPLHRCFRCPPATLTGGLDLFLLLLRGLRWWWWWWWPKLHLHLSGCLRWITKKLLLRVQLSSWVN